MLSCIDWLRSPSPSLEIRNWNARVERGLVKRAASCSQEETLTGEINPLDISFWTEWQSLSKCFVFHEK